jgi:hypothetical protein
MQEKAEEYSSNRTFAGTDIPTKRAFEDGAAAMYTELAPLVEWTDVNERLPKNSDNEQNIIVKCDNEKIYIAPYFRNNIFWSSSFCEIHNVKFWKLC